MVAEQDAAFKQRQVDGTFANGSLAIARSAPSGTGEESTRSSWFTSGVTKLLGDGHAEVRARRRGALPRERGRRRSRIAHPRAARPSELPGAGEGLRGDAFVGR